MNLTARADLVIRVAAECGLYTDVVGIGHVSSASSANVDVWLEVDGRPVADGSISESDRDVVFVDQEFALSPSQFDDPGATATIFEKTRSRHAYNWVVLDVDPGVHRVVVMARLRANATLPGRAKAVVGRRALVAVPTSLRTDGLF
jgi:hypothetical protein